MEGTSTPLVEDINENGLHERVSCPANKDPLLIPEILTAILKTSKLSGYDLKSCRLVSKLWNLVANPVFKYKFDVVLKNELKMQMFLNDMTATSDFPFSFFMIHPCDIKLETLNQFFTRYGSFIQILWIDPSPEWEFSSYERKSDPYIIPKIMRMFQNVPNLKSLTLEHIYVSSKRKNPFNQLSLESQDRSNFKSLKKLHSLDLTISENVGINFYTNILLEAGVVSNFKLKRAMRSYLPSDDAVLLAESVTTTQIKEFHIRGIPYSFLENLNRLPLLESFSIAGRQILSIGVGSVLHEFLTVHSKQLKILTLDDGVCVLDLEDVMDIPCFPVLVQLELAESDLFNPVTPAHVPSLEQVHLTVNTLRHRIDGSFEKVDTVKICGFAEDEEGYTILSLLPHLKESFPNLNTFQFNICKAEELEWVFENLQDLEGIAVTCADLHNYDFNEVLMGIEKTVANWIYENFLEDKEEALDIQRAARPFLCAPSNKPSLRNMKRLKKLNITIEAKEPRQDMTDACIFLSVMQITESLTHLELGNIHVSNRGFFQMGPLLQNFCRFSLPVSWFGSLQQMRATKTSNHIILIIFRFL